MSDVPKIQNTRYLFAAIFLLGAILRFSQLGTAPLTENEATNALAAFNLANGQGFQVQGESAYILLTALLFHFFRSSELFARFWPAFFGSLLVLAPFLNKEIRETKQALLFAFGLAILPPFVAISRQAEGSAIALAAMAFLVFAWQKGNSRWAGVLLATALLSGSSFFVGAFPFILLLLFAYFLKSKTEMAQWLIERWDEWKSWINSREMLIAFAISIGIGASFFLFIPQGIGGLGGEFSTFINLIFAPQKMGLNVFVLAILAYALPVILFATIGAVKNWKNGPQSNKFIFLWGILSVIWLLLFNGRRAEDLIWILLPMLWLASIELARYVSWPDGGWSPLVGTLFLLLVLAAFQLINFAALANADPMAESYEQRLIIAGVVFLLGAIALALIAGGWSGDVAIRAFYWTSTLLMALVFISQSARMGRDIFRSANELWAYGNAGGQTKLLEDSLNELSFLNSSITKELEIFVGAQGNSIKWILRDWKNTQFVAFIANTQLPEVIIADDEERSPRQASAYRGQDFVWSSAIDWEAIWPSNIFAWLLFKDAPLAQERIILWAREDLFPHMAEDNIINIEDFEESAPVE